MLMTVCETVQIFKFFDQIFNDFFYAGVRVAHISNISFCSLVRGAVSIFSAKNWMRVIPKAEQMLRPRSLVNWLILSITPI